MVIGLLLNKMDLQRDDVILEKHAELCGMFSNEKRLRILETLREGEMCVSDICEETGFPQPTVSSHLNKLKNHGVVKSEKEGLNTYYRVPDERIFEAIDAINEVLIDHLENQVA